MWCRLPMRACRRFRFSRSIQSDVSYVVLLAADPPTRTPPLRTLVGSRGLLTLFDDVRLSVSTRRFSFSSSCLQFSHTTETSGKSFCSESLQNRYRWTIPLRPRRNRFLCLASVASRPWLRSISLMRFQHGRSFFFWIIIDWIDSINVGRFVLAELTIGIVIFQTQKISNQIWSRTVCKNESFNIQLNKLWTRNEKFKRTNPTPWRWQYAW